ncbi:peptidase S8/S53 domain-containing protein [Amylocarpus encephaloides]|uniref:Peptidase S8/S53 domain-containing protein n=1 Tax=Amylocarpus encephaloides TaxID=45428 RepID=A0A9P7Y8A2_9HELO|nr:peptidase S8/S53 domain-containing protein [Amylocarpus encephaloides]
MRKIRSSNNYLIKETKSFIRGSAVDDCGHGTNVAGLVSKTSPAADLYIAKISNGKEPPAGTDQIIKAIEWAQKFKVHIINMSFGFLQNNEITLIEKTELEGVIFVASVSNYGGNRSRTFPADMSRDRVICIHVVDGYGNKSGMNPGAKRYDPNLSTLGVAVESIWPDDKSAHLEGASYAATIASTIAANVLKFALHAQDPMEMEEDLLDKHHVDEICRSGGMGKILLAMTEHRDGYNFIAPWRSVWDEDATVRSVAARFKATLKE